MCPKYATVSCHGVSMLTYDYQWVLHVILFQAKISELMPTLEFVQTYLDDLLCISYSSLDDHLAKLQRVFIMLWNAGLNVNACKSCFCAMETEYLVYILSRDGIKSQPK